MSFIHLPLLDIQRELHTMQRGMRRFRKYHALITGGTDDIVVPLGAMNPMARIHQTQMLEHLHTLDAEAIVAAAIEEANRRLPSIEQQVEVGIVAVDDERGGWTNRYFTEMKVCFNLSANLARGWAIVHLWTSETWTPERLRVETLSTIYRAAWALRHGDPRALGEMLAQEGMAARFAGAPLIGLDKEDIDYTREVLMPLRDSTDYPTQLAALFGDEAARSVGYPPLGVSERAGLALARAEADADAHTPVEAM